MSAENGDFVRVGAYGLDHKFRGMAGLRFNFGELVVGRQQRLNLIRAPMIFIERSEESLDAARAEEFVTHLRRFLSVEQRICGACVDGNFSASHQLQEAKSVSGLLADPIVGSDGGDAEQIDFFGLQGHEGCDGVCAERAAVILVVN